ncbi:MAG: hypothetical protein GTO24_05025 [candidate division Zixibacteria bacterium]|nr:hypothetical protein [candidate division Zixibacteria bacterium]
MSKTKPISLLFVGAVLLGLAGFSHASVLTGPFKEMKLELSHMPALNEKVQLIFSVTSIADVDSARVAFLIRDSANVRVLEGQKIRYCKFKKNKTQQFKLTLSFEDEGIFQVCGYAQRFGPGGGSDSNYEDLFVKICKNGETEILDSPPQRPRDKVRQNRPWGPAQRDSIRAIIERKKLNQR